MEGLGFQVKIILLVLVCRKLLIHYDTRSGVFQPQHLAIDSRVDFIELGGRANAALYNLLPSVRVALSGAESGFGGVVVEALELVALGEREFFDGYLGLGIWLWDGLLEVSEKLA